MKVLVTGVSGQLGYEVVKVLKTQGIEHLGCGPEDFDLRNEVATIAFIKNYQPNIVIHCAAYTAVDKAEEEQEICYDVNVKGTTYVTEACQELDATLVYISTEYVFDGKKHLPYEENDERKPLNVYGVSKSLAEDVVIDNLSNYFIVRPSWVFGYNGHNFVKTMLRLGRISKEVRVVDDQVGSPTYAVDLAYFLFELIKTDKFGIYHATNEGSCSWFEFATEIMKVANLDCQVKPISTKDYPTKAKRPFNSRLSKQKLVKVGFNKLPLWNDALKRYLIELKEGE